MKNRKRIIMFIIIAIIVFILLKPNIFIKNKFELNNTLVEEKITVPILGEITPKNVSLPIFSIILGVVDGFNPCAMWVLVLLIAMLLGMENRKKMWALGMVFIMTSGLVYLLFMLSWLNLTAFLTKIKLMRLLISILSIIFGMVNIYKYIKVRNDDVGCDVTNEEYRKKISNKIKKIMQEKSFILALLGIIILAILVNILELLCSLGLPVIFTQVLAINNLIKLQLILYFSIYIFFFLLDDILVFVIAMRTLNIKGVSNRFSKYSHLIGGIVMLLVGLLMVLKPEWLMFNFN